MIDDLLEKALAVEGDYAYVSCGFPKKVWARVVPLAKKVRYINRWVVFPNDSVLYFYDVDRPETLKGLIFDAVAFEESVPKDRADELRACFL